MIPSCLKKVRWLNIFIFKTLNHIEIGNRENEYWKIYDGSDQNQSIVNLINITKNSGRSIYSRESIKKIHKEFQSKRVGAFEIKHLKNLQRKQQNNTVADFKQASNVDDTFTKIFKKRKVLKSKNRINHSQTGSNSRRNNVVNTKYQELQSLFSQMVRWRLNYF